MGEAEAWSQRGSSPKSHNLSDEVSMPRSPRAAAARIKCKDTGQVASALPGTLQAVLLAPSSCHFDAIGD